MIFGLYFELLLMDCLDFCTCFFQLCYIICIYNP